MPRANRHSFSGLVWHLTHRCHRKSFLLRFARDRRRWRHWLFEAKKRYRLCVLNYIVTCNHVHLLVRDRGRNEISASMQLIASRVAQEFNTRKNRRGAFWEDRYHATAIQTDDHLIRCLVYVDLNMVRAGVVRHPRDWLDSGYHAIQNQPQRRRIVDHSALMALTGLQSQLHLRQVHADWVDTSLSDGVLHRQPCWTDSVAVGDQEFLQHVKRRIGAAAKHRSIRQHTNARALHEPDSPYEAVFGAKNVRLSG